MLGVRGGDVSEQLRGVGVRGVRGRADGIWCRERGMLGVPAIVFVLGVQLIGIYVSSVFYIAIFMIWLGKYPIWKAIAVSVGVSVALYLMFEFWFQVPLPHGSWFNPLEFVGVN